MAARAGPHSARGVASTVSRVGDAERTTPGRGAPTSHHNTTTITTALVSVSNCIRCSQNSRHENSLGETNSEIYIDQKAALVLPRPHLRILPPSTSGHSQHHADAGGHQQAAPREQPHEVVQGGRADDRQPSVQTPSPGKNAPRAPSPVTSPSQAPNNTGLVSTGLVAAAAVSAESRFSGPNSR